MTQGACRELKPDGNTFFANAKSLGFRPARGEMSIAQEPLTTSHSVRRSGKYLEGLRSSSVPLLRTEFTEGGCVTVYKHFHSSGVRKAVIDKLLVLTKMTLTDAATLSFPTAS